ncbi:MAG: hypothetical protein ABSE73_06975 [Planctomycetota bacterium]
MSSEGADFVDEIVQDKLPTHTAPPRDKFLPWHRVRKEFIRKFQWNELTARMLKRHWKRQLELPETEWSLDDQGTDQALLNMPPDVALERTLKCLVIPGEDLLDIRALWRDVQHFKCPIRYLGFNEGHGSDQQGTRVHVANNAVTSLSRVAGDSCVVQDRFEAIGNCESQAYHYLKAYGPYHVVNLDLCGSIFPNIVKDPQEYYEALKTLLIYQFAHQRTEWLLFVTTMVEPGVVHVGGLQKLCGPTRENVDHYNDFAERVAKLVPAQIFKHETASVDISLLNGGQMVQLFGVALGKWLLGLCHTSAPQWTAAMRRSYRYVINEDKGVFMLSLAFELSPNVIPPIDKTGMTKLQPVQKTYPDERTCAVKLAESAANIRDVDAELAANQRLKAELRDAQATLLEAAGYDRAAYLKWVEDGEVTANSG